MNTKKLKIRNLSIATTAIYIATFKAQGLPDIVQYTIQILMLLVVVMYFGLIRKKIYLKDISLVFSLSILASTTIAYFRGTVSITGFFNGLFYVICMFFMSQLIREWFRLGCYQELFRVLLRITIVYCAITFISVMIKGVERSEITLYFFGGKFISSYYFIFMLSLVYSLYQQRILKHIKWKVIFFLLCAGSLLFLIYIKCTTACVMILLMYTMSLIPMRVRTIFQNRRMVCSCIIISGCILFVIEIIMTLPVIQFIVADVMGKSLNLTSRIPIYTRYLVPLIKDNILLGYGHSSSILHTFTPYWNAQNGLAEILLNYGAFGVITFLLTAWLCTNKKSVNSAGWGCYILIYAFILAAVVEISYDYFFMTTLFILQHMKQFEAMNSFC